MLVCRNSKMLFIFPHDYFFLTVVLVIITSFMTPHPLILRRGQVKKAVNDHDSIA